MTAMVQLWLVGSTGEDMQLSDFNKVRSIGAGNLNRGKAHDPGSRDSSRDVLCAAGLSRLVVGTERDGAWRRRPVWALECLARRAQSGQTGSKIHCG